MPTRTLRHAIGILCVASCSTLGISGCRDAKSVEDVAGWTDEVTRAERAFAQTMAQRDHRRFQTYIADEAVFFDGDTPIVGRDRIAASWQAFFQQPDAPFSWEPDHVSVLRSGGLALSTGPVRDPSGKVIARFNSIWRREADGTWRVVFDRGNPLACAKEPAAPAPSG